MVETKMDLKTIKDQSTQLAIISAVEIGPLGSFIEDQYHKAFQDESLKKQVVHIEAELTGDNGVTIIRENFSIVTKAGYNKSNLKAFLDRNRHLPDETEQWLGEQVKAVLKTSEKSGAVYFGL
jgi:hypothetical protein